MTRILPIVWLLSLLASCGSVEEKRIRELMNEKGFGTRASGDATVETYVAGGDGVIFFLDPTVYQQPDAERLYFLTLAQTVGIDGTILIPYVGPVQVLGRTEAELVTLVKSLLRPYFQFEINLEARVINNGKAFFAFGEVLRRGRIPITKADITVFEAVTLVGWTQLANLGRVYLVRPDAQNPLVMEVNFSEIVFTGFTARNFRLRENDFIYVPPTFLGTITRFIQRLLTPLAAGVQALFGAASLRASYDILTGETSSGFFFRF